MFLTDSQKTKVSGALSPLYADAEFSGVTDFSVTVTGVPPVPVAETEVVDVPKV